MSAEMVSETVPLANGDAVITFPAAWGERVRALLPKLRNGPDYDRAVAEYLPLMSRFAKAGHLESAARYLCDAEHTMARDIDTKLAELMGLVQ